MSKLIKEDVLAQLTAAYQNVHGKAPVIEQKGSWFKVEGGKSLRLADLADLASQLTASDNTASPAVKAAPKATKKVAQSNGKGGLTAKQLWAKRIGQGSQLPRGCR